MRSALLVAVLATTTRASLVAKDRDHYQKYWARSRDKGRCDAKHCEWIGGFDTIDVDCRIEIDREGLASGGRGPLFSLLWNDGRRKLSIDAQDAAALKQLFETRPALCEYTPRNTTSDVALLMVANEPSYLFRMWGPFLNKLLYAVDAGLRPMLWLGDLPERLRTPTSELCLNSSEMRYLTDQSGAKAREARECSHRYIKIPATIAALAAPDIRGVYYVGMDAVARFPWSVDPNTLSEHRRRSSDVSFLVAHDGGLQWQVKGSRFYARDSAKGRAFFANWFENRCTGSDQYPLWHTMLESAASEGCVPYSDEIFGMRYSEAKHLKADDAPAALLLDCPSFSYSNTGDHPPDLLDDLRPQGAGRGGLLRLPQDGALTVENACFATDDGRCEYASDVSEFAALLGVAGRDRSLHPWNSTAASAPWEPIIGIGGTALLGGPKAGLNNAKDALFQLCRRGRKISYPTLRWNARVPNTPPLPSIAHEVLWDVDYWNAYVSNHSGCGLPHMVRDRPTTLIKTPGFANSLWLNTFKSGTQTPQGSLLVAHFHRALKPHPAILEVARRAAPPKPYGGVHLRLEDDLQGYAAFMRSRLGVRTNFELMARTKALEACAAGSTKLYVAVGLDVSDREDKSLLNKKKGPFGSTLVFKDGGDIARRFGEAAASVGAIVDTVVLADAAYYVGYAGLSTFDRTLVDIRATRDQWDARLARPDNCTFTVGKNVPARGRVYQPNVPAGRVYMRHFRSLP